MIKKFSKTRMCAPMPEQFVVLNTATFKTHIGIRHLATNKRATEEPELINLLAENFGSLLTSVDNDKIMLKNN